MPTLSLEPSTVTAAHLPTAQALREPGWLTLFDPLRILASLSVVWVHTRGELAFGVGFGLFLFLMMMFGLAAGTAGAEPLDAFARRKARGLLIPWLRWSLFYVLLYAVVDLAVLERAPWARLRWQMIAYGGSRHLWFLPYAMAAVLLVRACRAPLRRVPLGVSAPALALLSALGAGAAELTVQSLQLPLMARHWLSAAPALPLGLAFGLCRQQHEHGPRRSALLMLVAVGWFAHLLSPMSGPGQGLALRYAVAATLAALGFAWRPRVPRTIVRLSTLTFGVYLAHPLWMDILGLVPGVESWPAAVHVGLVWSGACLTVWLLRLLPVTWPELRKPTTVHRMPPSTGGGPDRARGATAA